MDPKIAKISSFIKRSDLDQTIKDILIRDLENEGLTDFLREQIKAYCLAELNVINKDIEEAKKILEDSKQQSTPA